jgi:hypothetical protein
MNEKYPDGRLVSEMLDSGVDYVVFKTSFYETADSEIAKCTGHARQSKTDHQSWFEKAEQKSRGRCLRVLLGSEPTFEEMEDVLINETNAAPKKEATKKKTLDEKVKELEAEGLVEDITDSKQAIMNNIKEFAMEITNQDLDKARAFTAQALGSMNMSKHDVSFANMQSVKNKIQDIATEARTHVDKGE